MRHHAPYMEWAKSRPAARFDLAISNVLGASIEDLPGAADALALTGRNDNGYAPLLEAIAGRYGVSPAQVTTAQGCSGANFLVYAALLAPGDDVLIEEPGYDPLLGAPRLVGANVVRFKRDLADGFALDPDRVRAAMTPRTRLIVITSPHNPTGAVADRPTLEAIGDTAANHGAYVVVDEVYLDTVDANPSPAAAFGDRFISTSSLTKSYGLAGLRCGWILSSEDVAAKLRRARDVVDGTGSIVAERLGVLAFQHLDALHARAKRILDTNRPVALEVLRRRPELELVEPQGGTVAFPRLKEVDDTSHFAEQLLRERDTAIVPGRFFQAPQHFRLGFSGPEETLREGLARLEAALDARAW
jgi:aspartate/methionine/tyrosine aminotransferase